MAKLKCVVFDMDGTLVDSESVHDECFQRVFKKYGANVSHEELLTWNGIGVPGLLEKLTALTGSVKEGQKWLDESLVDLEQQLLTGGFPTFDGAKELLVFCKQQGLIVGLATSSLKEWGEVVASKTGIDQYFDFMFFGDDVKNMKPEPDVYLMAAKQAGATSEECLVFEDSLVGVEAAHRAGLPVVQILRGQPKSELATGYITSFDEAKAIVKEKLRPRKS